MTFWVGEVEGGRVSGRRGIQAADASVRAERERMRVVGSMARDCWLIRE